MQRLIYDSWIGWFPKWSKCNHEEGFTQKVYTLRHDLLNFYISRLGDRWFIGGERGDRVNPNFPALTLNPSPRRGEGLWIQFPFSLFWKKGLGDEGKLVIGILWRRSPFEHSIYLMQAIAGLWMKGRSHDIFFLANSTFPKPLPLNSSSSRLMYYSVVMRRSLLRSSIIA